MKLQVVPLPAEPDGRVPYLLLFTEAAGVQWIQSKEVGQRLKEYTGARSVLIFEETVEVVQ